jgi:hypothetical protein
MRKRSRLIGLCILFAAAGISLSGQQSSSDRAVVNFSNPAKPGRVEVELPAGTITVRGYEGKEVIVEARWREKLLTARDKEVDAALETLRQEEKSEEEKAKEKALAEKAKGMKPIQVESSGLVVEEEENVIRVETESWKRAADLTIQVPYSTSLQLGCGEAGGIIVERVDGEIEVHSSDGGIILTGVSGPVVADSSDGEIKVVFGKLNLAKPMSLSSSDGDIDITLPADAKASLKMKTGEGKIFTDFDINLTPSQQKKEEDERKEGGRYRLAFEKTSLGLINGGGVEIQLTTSDGNIFIRKAK